MNKKIAKWLQGELPLWKEKGWLSEAGQTQLEASYNMEKPASGPSLTRIAVLLLGAVLIGLGIFLLFAGYWYSFSPNGRFDWTITLVVASLVILGLAIWRCEPGKRWAEGATIFYMLALGGSTFLMADTYYTGESYGLYLLIVLIASLPAIYVLRSSLGMIGYLLGAILWCFAPYSLDITLNVMAVWLLILGALPFYMVAVKHSSSYSMLVWLSWAYVAAIFSAFFLTIESNRAGLELYFVATLAVSTYAIGTLMRDKGLWTLPFRTMGSIGLLYVVIQGTLLHTWNISIQDALNGLALTMAILLGAVCAYFLGKLVMKREWVAAVMTLTPFIVGFGLLLANSGAMPLVVSIVFDAFVLLTAFILFLRGTMDKRVGYVNGAILAVLALILARFFDPGFTFFERGISFISIGILVIVVNIIYMWSKSNNKLGKAHEERKARRQAFRQSLREQYGESQNDTFTNQKTLSNDSDQGGLL